ncbi:MAG: iron-sulfur cluster assembly accessory protein, partial [Deltaproteobacteria bacterium]|nr:iron-sulfur cluster assembly accessory protein [Deltaproteobacteria bacterium]
GGGCSGLQYKIQLEPSPRENDRVVESEEIKVFVDPKSALYLGGTQIDYDESLMGGGFKFVNPNATGGCGCGKSFSA